MSNINRRQFLKIMGKSSMAIVLSSYLVPSELSASTGSEFDDFKALVVVQMGGGHDGLSMFVPSDATANSVTGYGKYAEVRSDELRIKNTDMMSDLRAKRGTDDYLSFGTGKNLYDVGSASEITGADLNAAYTKGFYRHNNHFDSKIATNALMPEFANLLDLGLGAVVQNVGSARAIYTKQELRDDPKKLPPFIGSHDEGTTLAETGQANSIYYKTGWLGRLSDAWPDLQRGSVHKMNINLSKFGSKKMMHGAHSIAFNIGFEGPVDFDNLNKAHYSDILSTPKTDKFKKLFKKSREDAYDNLETLLTDWKYVIDNDPFADEKDSYGNALFDDISLGQHYLDDGINGDVIKNFATAARLIYNAKRNGDKRIVICISAGGYDTHSGQDEMQVKAYRGLSIALEKFTKAMNKEITYTDVGGNEETVNLSDKVTTFNMSEFGRTAVSNGNGTDHGWGGSHFVLGGAVNPGNHGTFPDLTPGSDDDTSTKGRFIPTTSYTQYYATIVRWFGADDAVLHAVFPELENFTNEDGSFTDVGFMKSPNIV